MIKETNMEHFRSEIEKNEYSLAMTNGKITNCQNTDCGDCEFNTIRCVREKIKWLMSEYKPEPVLTQREKHFVEFAQEGWLARDESGVMTWFSAYPRKDADGYWNGEIYSFPAKKLTEIFLFINWEDESPWSIEELRKLKVK